MSYSTIHEIEQCPRRWALENGRYPSIWGRTGYPRPLSISATEGAVLHASLERVVKALVEDRCTDIHSECAYQTLSRLGGYSRIIAAAIGEHLESQRANPRAASQIDRAERVLRSHIPELRGTLQNLVSTIQLASPSIADVQRPNGSHQRLLPGAYAEVELTSNHLAWKGRADLLLVEDDGCKIVDFKTGEPSPSHGDQLSIYALLWHLDEALNPDRTLAKQLSIRYVDRETAVVPPTGRALVDLEAKLKIRTDEARQTLARDPPPAKPSPDLCRSCPVRHLCSDYWMAISDWPTATLGAPFTDCEVLIHKRHGSKSWDASILRAWGGPRGSTLVRTLDESVEFSSTATIRLLGVAVEFDAEGHRPFAHDLVSTSEWCEISAGDLP